MTGTPALDPAVEAFVAALTADPPPPDMPIDELRAFAAARIDGIFAAANPEPPPAVARNADRSIPVAGGEIAVRVYTPYGDPPFPLYVHLHGGGWALSSIDALPSISMCLDVCARAGCVVIDVGYRLAPEFPFPTPAEDCYAALAWAVDRAGELGVDAAGVAVGGESAGGNLAAAVALMARDRGGPRLVLQLLEVAATDLAGIADVGRYPSVAYGYTLTAEIAAATAGLYVASPDDLRHPYASPIFAEDLAGVAPAHVMTAELDCLRDSAEEYGRRLQEAGVPTRISRHAGHVHGAGGLLVGSWEPARAWREEVVDVLRAAFA